MQNTPRRSRIAVVQTTCRSSAAEDRNWRRLAQPQGLSLRDAKRPLVTGQHPAPSPNQPGKVNWWVYELKEPKRGSYVFTANVSFQKGEKGYYAVLNGCKLKSPPPDGRTIGRAEQGMPHSRASAKVGASPTTMNATCALDCKWSSDGGRALSGHSDRNTGDNRFSGGELPGVPASGAVPLRTTRAAACFPSV